CHRHGRRRAVMASRSVMASRGRRGFTISAVGFVALTVLAVGSRADGKNGPSSEQAMKVATVAAQKANLAGLRAALMPLLMYVKGGQPRDTLRSMAAGHETPVSPAVIESLADAVRTAVEDLGKMPVKGGDAARSRDTA